MKRVFFYIKQKGHRKEILCLIRKLKARGISCRVYKRTAGDTFSDLNRKFARFLDRHTLVITDDVKTAGICDRKKIACIGFDPPDAENKRDYFPRVRMVWESFKGREPEELEQFWRRFYGKPVIIARTERLLIRESIAEDFEAVYHMRSREDFSAGNSRKQEIRGAKKEKTDPYNDYREEKEKFCSYVENVYLFYGYGYWTVELTRPDQRGTVIGWCGLKDYDPAGRDGYIIMRKAAGRRFPRGFLRKSAYEPFRLELGYIVAKRFRRQGYASEMCWSVLAYAFTVLKADEIVVRIHPRNVPSLRLARRLGFRVWGAAD